MATRLQTESKAPSGRSLAPAAAGLLQRKCACGNYTTAGGECEECKKKPALQRVSHPSRGRGTQSDGEVPPIVYEVLRSPGQPLDPATRAFMEPRFGHDFSHVRVHTDAKAAESARAVSALAYAVGRDVVFGKGQYAPKMMMGRKLLTHELAHVVQQSSGASAALQTKLSLAAAGHASEREADQVAERVIESSGSWHVTGSLAGVLQRYPVALQRKTDRCSASGTSCALADRCAEPDPGSASGEASSTTWHMLVKIDVERSSFEEALRNKEVGHTNVAFRESNGRRFSYGFYPAGEVPNENRRTVPGCVRHPDTTHDSCIDETVAYSLTQAQYNTALALAQQICRDRRTYGVNYTCTTYAEEVARAASQSLPSSRSAPMTIYYQAVPPIDNPNTLLENVEAERRRDPNRRFPIWNDPCTNQCEADFDRCLRSPRRPLSGLQGPQCMMSRDRCFRQCPARR